MYTPSFPDTNDVSPGVVPNATSPAMVLNPGRKSYDVHFALVRQPTARTGCCVRWATVSPRASANRICNSAACWRCGGDGSISRPCIRKTASVTAMRWMSAFRAYAKCISRGAYAPRSCVAVRTSAGETTIFAMHKRTFAQERRASARRGYRYHWCGRVRLWCIRVR